MLAVRALGPAGVAFIAENGGGPALQGRAAITSVIVWRMACTLRKPVEQSKPARVVIPESR